MEASRVEPVPRHTPNQSQRPPRTKVSPGGLREPHPATRRKLDKLFSNCKRAEKSRLYRDIPQTREGSRHTVLLEVAGYIAGTDPSLTGVVELLNGMMAEPMDGADPSLDGLVQSYEEWRYNAINRILQKPCQALKGEPKRVHVCIVV